MIKTLFPLLTLLLVAQPSLAVTVSASVNGDIADIVPFTVSVDLVTGQQVPPVPDPNFLVYGDFLVSFSNDLGATTSTVGDGENDQIDWLFDFTTAPGFAAFDALSTPLTSARVTMQVVPTKQFFEGDGFFIWGVPGTYSTIDDATVTDVGGGVYEVEIEMIGGASSSADILSRLASTATFGVNDDPKDPGQLGARYFDDALLTSATMELTRQVPEPSGLVLALLLGVAISGRRARVTGC